ncbi:LysR substrate-binding domain-containing protein [Ectopseudomonas khazarica]|uniref:LysR substrate-binding domain-containing protein n=1 Tax=Ectopseudomonas khazarica TaxID=2502979 RepID=UPI00384B4D09
MEARLAIDDFPIHKSAALAGLGVTMLPTPLCHEELRAGRLVALLSQHLSEAINRWNLPL